MNAKIEAASESYGSVTPWWPHIAPEFTPDYIFLHLIVKIFIIHRLNKILFLIES